MTIDTRKTRETSEQGDKHHTAMVSPTRTRILLYALLIVAACVAAYAGSIGTYFQYDDFMWLLHARDWSSGDLGLFDRNFSNNFRPGTHVIVYATYLAFKDWAPGYHIVSVALHIAVSLGLFALIGRLSGDGRAALIGALLFAVAPGQSETVAWVAGQPMLVVGASMVGGLLAAHQYAVDGRRVALVFFCVLTLLGLFSHEFAVAVPIVSAIFAVLVVRGWSSRRCNALIVACAVVTAVWFAAYLAYYLLRGQGICETGEPSQLSFARIPWNFFGATPGLLMPDIRLAAIQHRLPEVFPWLVGPVHALWTVLRVAIPVLLTGFVVFGSPLQRMAALWCVLGIGLGSLSSVGFAGRYLYLPMMGFSLALGSVLSSAASRKRYRGAWIVAGVVLSTIVVLDLTANNLALAYLRRNARERYSLIGELRRLHRTPEGRKGFVLSGLPDKYEDTVIGAIYYGIPTATEASGKAPIGAMALEYTPEGWVHRDQ